MSELAPRPQMTHEALPEEDRVDTGQFTQLAANLSAPTPLEAFGRTADSEPVNDDALNTSETPLATTGFEDDTAPANQEAPTLSFADRLRGAAVRISDLLNNTATKIDQRTAFSSYEDNIKATKQRERQERLQEAVMAVRKIGKSALEAAKTTGLVTLGLGFMAGEQAYKGAKVAAEKTKDAVDFGVQGYYDTAEAVKDTFRDARDTAIDTVTDTRDAVVEKAIDIRNAIKEKLIAAKNRALDRRAARRAKWSARKDAALNWVNNTKEQALYAGNLVKDAAVETVGTLKENGQELVNSARQEGQRFVGETANRISTARAAGSAALEAYAATTQAHNEQNKL